MVNRPDFLDLLRERVIVFDGATGTYLQRRELSEDDFGGKEGCNEILVETRPDVVRDLHDSFLSVGCHVVETNSFGATRVVLAEYGLADQAYALNKRAAELAMEVARDYTTVDRPRYVAGSMGPGTKLPSLGHMTFDELVKAYQEQAAGLLDGGADVLVIETCQDLLQVRATLLAVRREQASRPRRVPVMVSLTMEASGTMLLGTELSAAMAALLPLRPDILGLNCATGPLEMKQHVRLLSRSSPLPISALPNAGLPQNVGGETVYPLEPEEFAQWHASFISEDGVQVVGGCCGTTSEHLARLVSVADELSPAPRTAQWPPSLSSLYFSVPLAQNPKPFLVGERTNANGSKAFKELLLQDEFDGMVELARDQERGGAHALDLCAAYVGRDEVRDVSEIVSRFARQVRVPLVLDTTQPEVMEAALKLCGGRCVLNSINLEDGEERARQVLALARDFGAAVVALAIDEQGMARTVERKLAVAERLLRLATEGFGLEPQDMILDMLTFTVGSGDETLRDAAVQTLDAIEALKARFPGVWTILGVSNISFGLKRRSRRVLNSVFLSMAVERGLDLAIVDAGKLLPLSRMEPRTLELAEDLLLDRRENPEVDPLFAFINHFKGRKKGAGADEQAVDDTPLPQRIHCAVVEGNKKDLELLLAAALGRNTPLQIINEMLIPAMKEVGELFGAGKMQLPFVLQSAEVMKHAVAYLEPRMERGDTQASKTSLVLATVKGDVHDIGKNLVDILLSNNGYQVHNIGIKVPVEEMIRIWQEQKADAIGMSGLLVKSTMIMKENLEELRRRGMNPPVLLGGAALTRRYVEQDLREVYGQGVHYGRDAFDALQLMQQVDEGSTAARGEQRRDAKPATLEVARARERGEDPYTFSHPPQGIEEREVPLAPFWGTREVELPLDQVFELINETTLFRGQWQYRRGELSKEEYEGILKDEVRPAFEQLKQQAADQRLLVPRGVYGYFPCYSEDNEVIILDPEVEQEVCRLSFPRQRKAPFHCIADFFKTQRRPPDLIGCFVVTVGAAASDRTRELFQSHRYLDYLRLHGLSVETAEAAAELLHSKMRQEMGLPQRDAKDIKGLLRQGYQGARYSFGYPACPRLEDQQQLFNLLEPDAIGVSLTDSWQMEPEQTVSAFVVHHPAAKYFAV